MEVLLIDIDSMIPNLALKKIEKYHIDKGDNVIWDIPLAIDIVEKIYVSCIFSSNKHKCSIYEGKALIGGTGYDLHIKLPPEIDSIKPKINWGFTTRGCIRKCPFCVVPEKEGKIHAVGDVYDIWDGVSRDITIMDNNILALPRHFELICEQLINLKLRVDFNQGLDHRLLNSHIAKLLHNVSHKEYHLSFDTPDCKKSVEKAIDLLQAGGISRCIWYVLVGFNTTYQEDLDRLNYLRDRKQNAFVQRYNKKTNKFYTTLARWANQHPQFYGKTWEQFCEKGI